MPLAAWLKSKHWWRTHPYSTQNTLHGSGAIGLLTGLRSHVHCCFPPCFPSAMAVTEDSVRALALEAYQGNRAALEILDEKVKQAVVKQSSLFE